MSFWFCPNNDTLGGLTLTKGESDFYSSPVNFCEIQQQYSQKLKSKFKQSQHNNHTVL